MRQIGVCYRSVRRNSQSLSGARAFSVDWWRVITDLMQSGMSQREIGRRCGCEHANINTLRNSLTAQQPRFALGVNVLALWMEVLDKGAQDIPMVRTSTGQVTDPRAAHLIGEFPHVRTDPATPDPSRPRAAGEA